MRRTLLSALALLLCLSLLLPGAACAEEGLLDHDEIQAMLDDYISAHGLDADKISVGYIYTATGDTFYYNEDRWYYSASTYKVPVMMLLAEQEAAGEIDRETKLKGLTLGYAEEAILTYSNNDYAHLMMSVLAPTEPECRDLYKQYASLPDDYYISDFRDYSYFTARFLTEVIQTLYTEPERFPNIIDCLLSAQPDHYFRLKVKDYPIAQKYGSFKDNSQRDFNHTTGVIYLPNPIILTVMTQDAPGPETVIGDIAELFVNYSLALDARLEAYRAEQEAQRIAAEEEARRLEAERLAAEEAARLEAEAEATTEPTAEATPAATPSPVPTAPETESGNINSRLYVLIVCAIVLLLAAALTLGRRKHK